MLYYRGNNRDEGCGIQKIQNKVVKNISLYGWTGYGLNALDKYDNEIINGCDFQILKVNGVLLIIA